MSKSLDPNRIKNDEVTSSVVLPLELWKKIKIKAIKEGISLREIITRIFMEYISKDD